MTGRGPDSGEPQRRLRKARRVGKGGAPPVPESERTACLAKKGGGPSDRVAVRRTCRAASALPEIRSTLRAPKGIMPWERELLLPLVLATLTDFVESNEHGKPNLDEKAK